MRKKRINRPRRKHSYLIVKNIGDCSIREILKLQEVPMEEKYAPKEDGNSTYCIGPFRTNKAAELMKDNPGLYKTVAEAEKAASKFILTQAKGKVK